MPQHLQNPDFDSNRIQKSAADLAAEAKLDAYLDTICANVPREVPATAVQEMRQEMYGHLVAALSAHCELGKSEEETVSHILTQFGRPEIVARQWKQEWEETLAQKTNAPFRLSIRPALGVWATAYIVLLGIGGLLKSSPAMPDILRTQWTLLGVFGIPLLSGAAVGLLARQRPTVSNLVAAISVFPVYLLIIAFQLNAISPGGWKSALWFAINPFVLWLPLSSVATALTAHIRKLSQRRLAVR